MMELSDSSKISLDIKSSEDNELKETSISSQYADNLNLIEGSLYSPDYLGPSNIYKTEEVPKQIWMPETISQPLHSETYQQMESAVTYKVYSTAQLRKIEPSKNKLHGTVTKVQPFQLTECTKRKHEEAEYVPLAEQVANFQKKTPQRYHTSGKSYRPPQHWEPPSLNAKSPNLHAVKRCRTLNVLSREEQEQKEIEQMKENQFRACPIDPKIYGFSSVAKTNRASLARAAKKKQEHKKQMQEKRATFRARPIPKHILSGPTGLGKKPQIPNTIPQAPAFKTENRLEKRKEMEKERPKEIPKKVQPSKLQGPPPVVPLAKKRTEVQPFSFDEKDQKRFALKEQKIKDELEKEAKVYEFNAQPVPYPTPSVLPSVPVKAPTVPQPFHFELEGRTNRSNTFPVSEDFTFKANPANVLKKEPFIPEKGERQAIGIKEFHMYTDRRASDRCRLREMKKAEEEEQKQRLLLQKAQDEAKEQAELQRLRRDLVHKANPVRQYPTVEIKQSDIPLTEPVSPNFTTDRRLRSAYL